MKTIIINYLIKNYQMTLSTPSSFLLYNKKTKENEALRSVISTMQKIFSTTEEVIYHAFEDWCDREAISINNRIVDLQDKLYLETGKVINLDINDINKYLIKDDVIVSNF
jgi:hypothetical protein